MSKSSAMVGGAVLGAVAMGLAVPAFTAGSSGSVSAGTMQAQQFLAARPGDASAGAGGLNLAAGVAMAGAGMAAAAGMRRSRRSAAASSPSLVPVGMSSPVASEQYFRDHLVARRAELREAGECSVEETDQNIRDIEAFAKQALAGAAAAMVFTSEAAVAYPIFAQQNYANPREYGGKLACANCHLASKPIDARVPNAVLPDTIFKAQLEVPAKYEKRMQPIADGSKATMNIGAICIMPEGWKLAPKDRLPKVLKKEMKGLSWSPYSKEFPNIVVAGPVPGAIYETMVLPILSPNPETNEKIIYGKQFMYFGGNRGRGQVYPEGNQSNNNQFFAAATGKVSAIEGLKITIQMQDGSFKTQEVLPGADIVVTVGEEVSKDDPITTNPNVGGFGQAEVEVTLQDMNRVYAYSALSFSFFLCQLSFVLKKKQFEKVQLAEGF